MDPAWNRGSEEEQPSYLWAMLTTPLNVNLFLATLASSTFLSIPYGAPGAILPLPNPTITSSVIVGNGSYS